MDSSSYRGASSFPVNNVGSRPRYSDLTIYESTPHYPVPNYSIGGRSSGEAVEEDEGEGATPAEREHMFDKVVTPSDVGKLNRLVIPKQHAEKYFPLDSNSGDSKGLLLNFEDRKGKSWRFRYSYWNSSQSYVMTKGWSRFVKEKKLDAGDVVSFYRGVAEKERFYIDWRRRRPDAPPSIHHHYPLYRGFHPHLYRPIHHPQYFLPPQTPAPILHHQARELHHYRPSVTNNSSSGCYGGNYGTLSPNFYNQSGSVIYLGSAAAPPPQHQPMVFNSVPVVVHGAEKASSKRLRLFGVNMDCNDDIALDSDQVSSSSGESGLQLSLNSGLSAVDKGKSSMSLDLDI